ncbi:hypothetical protein [Halorussus pelagicus]|uniref:hypothetical protein n=1 Tax=Halorussus pelagicus TaxID=2505977 RepID=UPI000FFB1E5C|nr:hypothetical protein [Halorussus pelagicus]
MAISEQAVTTLVPLLLLVILELSRIARDIDLTEVVNQNHGFFLFSDNKVGKHQSELGRFNFLHAASTVLLAFVLFLCTTSESDVRFVLGVFLWAIWVLLPVLEVEEYDTLLANGVPYSSFHFHVVASTVSAISIAFYTEIRNLVASFEPILVTEASVPFVFIVLLIYTCTRIFLSLLEDEIEQQQCDNGQRSEPRPRIQSRKMKKKKKNNGR